MIKEFKKFIFRGNVMDLAVGVVVGSSFTAIVNSLVNNIIMPFIGVLTSGVNFKDITIDLSGLSKALGNTKIPETGLTMSIGVFINSIVEFIIIAATIFLVVKAINVSREKMESLTKKEEEKEKKKEVVIKSDEVKLLEEIRNLLKEKKKK